VRAFNPLAECAFCPVEIEMKINSLFSILQTVELCSIDIKTI